jgi:hypothetical protein
MLAIPLIGRVFQQLCVDPCQGGDDTTFVLRSGHIRFQHRLGHPALDSNCSDMEQPGDPVNTYGVAQ